MPTEEVNSRELIKKRLDELNEEIGRLKFDDEKRPALIKQAEAFAKMLNDMDQLELTRLSNNWKNQNDEEKLIVEKEKIKVDKKRINLGKWQLGIGAGLSIAMELVGYFLNEWFQPDRRLYQSADSWAKNIRDSIKNMR